MEIQLRNGGLSMIKHGGMAVSSDIGARNNVHPPNKRDVCQRLARWALKDVYGHAIVPSDPLVKRAVHRKVKLIVSFEYGKGLSTREGESIRGFSVDGKNPVGASIRKDAIVIPVSDTPEFLYYGWKPWTEANLVNAEGLPASTFNPSCS